MLLTGGSPPVGGSCTSALAVVFRHHECTPDIDPERSAVPAEPFPTMLSEWSGWLHSGALHKQQQQWYPSHEHHTLALSTDCPAAA
eukprot:scaffold3775_cov29-Prasinocladus_malaysianus.AAC.4